MKKKTLMVTAIFVIAVTIPILIVFLSQDDEVVVIEDVVANDLRVMALEESEAVIENSDILKQPMNEEQLNHHIEEIVFGIQDGVILDGRLNLESPQDLITFRVMNGRAEPYPFLMKLFYNYEAVPFRIAATEEYVTEFLFMIESDHEMHLPIYLSPELEADEMLNKLTFALFRGVEEYVRFDPFYDMSYGFVLNFEISYGGEEPLSLPIQPVHPLESGPEMNMHALIIGVTDLSTDGFTSEVIPPHRFQVSPGEEVAFSFQTNPYGFVDEDVHSFLILLMVDWQQVPINGQPYLHFYAEDNENIGNYSRFVFIAPEEPGFYEIGSLLIVNPTSPNSQGNFVPIETGLRFTIEVVE
ncbi:MAG: hypothetical protein FWE07_01850 [Turicibacter sp.]|nr:hypothetical protein [Turicibacter sp.]